jgi:quercetin dioxygenase-like cupin family protein
VNENAVSLNPKASRSRNDIDTEISSVVRVLADDRATTGLGLVEEGGSAWAVAWPGVGSHLRSMHRISLSAGGVTRRMRHPMEAVYYVISGDLVVEDIESGLKHRLVSGSMAFVEANTGYRFVAGQAGSELVGGPCPPDPGIYQLLMLD